MYTKTNKAMTARQKKAESKRTYEAIKDIRSRYEAGEPTTFAERNIMFMYLKKMEKRRKEKSAVV